MRALLLLLVPMTVSAQWMQLDCSSLADGVYGEECSSSVTLCLHGEALDSLCSSGSLFNARLARCTPYASEEACANGDWQSPRDARPCMEIGNWRRGEGACSPQYNACLDGETHTLLCPSQSFYDESQSTCTTEPSDCLPVDGWRADGGGDEDVATICAGAGSDGFYALGCSSRFAACTAGAAQVMSCPADLVYDEERKKCEYPGNVVACGGVAPEEGSGIEGSGFEGSGAEGSGEVEGSGSEEGSGEIEDISDACVARADGFYRLGDCSEHFLGCSGGVAYRMFCPASLKYDEETQMCDYPGNVKGCEDSEEEDASGEGSGEVIEGSGTDEGSGVEGSGSEGSGSEGSGSEGSGSEGSGSEGSGSEGSGSEGSGSEGSGSEGSGSEGSGAIEGSGVEFDDVTTLEDEIAQAEDVIVVEQHGGRAEVDEEVKRIEAEDEIIDSNGVVEEKEEVIESQDDVIEEEEANGVAVVEEKEARAEEDIIVEEDADEAAPVAQHVQQATAAAPAHNDENEVPSCAGRGDGFYQLGCSSEMLACSNGMAHIMPCPEGLVFDERNQMCDYPVHVAACAAREEELSEDNLLLTREEERMGDHPEIPRRNAESIVDATLAPTTPAAYGEKRDYGGPKKIRRDARCKSSSGFFSLGCSTQFVSCTDGVATTVECGDGEAFDEQGQSCVPLARHPLCFAHAVRPTDVIDEDVQMVKDEDDENDLQKPVDHSFPCSKEGAYAESECSDWFTLCEKGRGLELYCLQGFLFDGVTAKCVPAGQLAHCQAQ